ncbi:MAG: CPBP family intramembrane metalloprotease [Bacteroidales bacterium]|nr:CPBP family intramembrane metalloprotease [Bacteroidales bacterium]
MVQIILFIAALILYVAVYPISGYYHTRVIRKSNNTGFTDKSSWYRQSMFWSWIPTLIIISVLLIDGHSPESLGLDYIDPGKNGMKGWIVIVSLISYIAYICYLAYNIIAIRFDKKKRREYEETIPDELRFALPVSKKEKGEWKMLAISAGITEEIQYRGYLFFAMQLLFPNISIWIVLAVSSAVFGIGHIYQRKEAYKPLLAGIYFGFLYIVLGSVIPVIIIHIMQDLIVTNLIEEPQKNDFI